MKPLLRSVVFTVIVLSFVQQVFADTLLERNRQSRTKVGTFAALYSEKVTVPKGTTNQSANGVSQSNAWGTTNTTRHMIYAICETGYYAESVPPAKRGGFWDDSVILVKNGTSYESASGGLQGMMRERMAAYGQEHPLLFPFAPRIGQNLTDLFPLGNDQIGGNVLQHRSGEYFHRARFVDKEGMTLVEELTDSGPNYRGTTTILSWRVVRGRPYPSHIVQKLLRIDGTPLRQIEYTFEKELPFKKEYRDWAGWKENALVITDHGEYLYQNGKLVPDPRYADSRKGKLMRRVGSGTAVFLFAAVTFGLVVRAHRRSRRVLETTG